MNFEAMVIAKNCDLGLNKYAVVFTKRSKLSGQAIAHLPLSVYKVTRVIKKTHSWFRPVKEVLTA